MCSSPLKVLAEFHAWFILRLSKNQVTSYAGVVVSCMWLFEKADRQWVMINQTGGERAFRVCVLSQ